MSDSKARAGTGPSRGGRKKRVLMSAEERKLQILGDVTQAFAHKGFEGVRTTDLAKAAGVSQALLYKLFGDKRGLYRAMIRRKLEEAQDGILGIDPALEADDEAYLSEVALRILRGTREDPNFVRLLLYSELAGSEFSTLLRETHSDRSIDHLTGYFETRREAGALGGAEPRFAAWAFLGMVWQFSLSAFVFGGREPPGQDVEVVARDFARLFLFGARAPRES